VRNKTDLGMYGGKFIVEMEKNELLDFIEFILQNQRVLEEERNRLKRHASVVESCSLQNQEQQKKDNLKQEGIFEYWKKMNRNVGVGND